MPRIERDSLGEVPVPDAAYYGAQTARALENFPVSGMRPHPDLVTATVLVKKCAAEANRELGRLEARVADAIIAAADEVLAGRLRDQFVVDVYQAGAGTSHNMNANEVLANRAAEILGEPRGSYAHVHPNDHVNMGQSTNDVFPTATRLALLSGTKALIESARELSAALDAKAASFEHVLKVGRTHLQDAVPITLGQEFSGYAASVARGADDVERASEQLLELNLGSTAVGTGLNAGDDYTQAAIAALARESGFPVVPAANRFRVTQSMGDVLAVSGAMRRLAVEIGRVASDLRLLAMGPRAGIAEVRLPAVQPGSSIMPGKVNPSIPEMVNQVCFQVIGCDATIAAAADAGQLELNVMMPVIAWNALHAAGILARAAHLLATRTIEGLEADEARCRELLDRSTAVATALSPYLGYAVTADVAKEAVATGRSIRDVVLSRRLLEPSRLDEILSPAAMTTPGIVGSSAMTRAAVRGVLTALLVMLAAAPDVRAAGSRATAVSARRTGRARRAGPRRLAEAGSHHGRAARRRRVRGRRRRRRRRMVHRATRPARRPERHGLRAGRAGADARGDRPPRPARGIQERQARARRGRRSEAAFRRARRRAHRRLVSRVPEIPSRCCRSSRRR